MKVNIYRMELHDHVVVPITEYMDYHIVRVPSGWIYSKYFKKIYKPGKFVGEIFVPYNDEFIEIVKEKSI